MIQIFSIVIGVYGLVKKEIKVSKNKVIPSNIVKPLSYFYLAIGALTFIQFHEYQFIVVFITVVVVTIWAVTKGVPVSQTPGDAEKTESNTQETSTPESN